MKKIITLAAAAVLLTTIACTQKTERTVDETGTTETTTVSATYPTVDTAATAQATSDAATAANEAARQTGTALEHAGQEIQEETTTAPTTNT